MTGRVGFVMLVHASLDRAAQVARHWAGSGCPVVIHIDNRVAAGPAGRLQAALADFAHVRFASRRRCEWGTWSIVEATIDASRLLLDSFPEVRHVFLASGSCLPLRPVCELETYLATRPDTDFIESVASPDVAWTTGGFDTERFSYLFPFSWKRNRRLFDAAVSLQKSVGFRRRMPEGIVPHLGSQWWCLTRRTLEAMFADPGLPRYRRFFRRSWIPDESFFQTVVRRHTRRIESRSLTLAKFDFQGKPHIFYDDHLQLLRRSDCFVARKIWPKANLLYDSFLSNDPAVTKNAEPNPGRIDRLFSKANERRTRGRPGLRMQSRYPREGFDNDKTCAPYSVFEGFAEIFEGFETWLEKAAGGRVHGHLFAPGRAEFAGGETSYNGALGDSATLRDYDPSGFLISLLWNTRGERQCFQFGPADNQAIGAFLAADRNAHVTAITGAWAVPLFRSGREVSDLRAEAARLQTAEAMHLALLRTAWAKAQVRVWSLAEFLEAPMEPLQTIMDQVAPRSGRRLAEAPRLVGLRGFPEFLQRLRNEGINPYLVGDLSGAPDLGAVDRSERRGAGRG